MTLWIPGPDTPGGGALTDTGDFNFAPAIVAGAQPSETNITFNFSPQDAFVDATFVYGITFNTAADEAPVAAADSLNVALSSSATDLSVGTDTVPGTVWMDDINGNNNDFPTCTTGLPTTGFVSIVTDCGPYNPANPGAYGTSAEVAAGSADIPAVEFNVVGGVVPPLYPGGPAEPVDFAITNPGVSSVHVSQVYTTVSGLTGTGSIVGDEACSTTMYPVAPSPDNVNLTVPSGTTIVSPSGVTIKMTDDGNNQDNCEGATVDLSFSSL